MLFKWLEPHSFGGSAMSRPMTVPKPSTAQLRRVHLWLEKPLQPWQRRRAEVLLLYAAGLPASTIAPLLQVHANTVYADLHDFARHGLSFLSRPRTIGAPPRLLPEASLLITDFGECAKCSGDPAAVRLC